MRIFAKIVIWVLILVGIVVAGIIFWLRSSLPEMTGEIDIAGLSAPVEIIRDRNAIPHIYAKTDSDLFMAVGFVQAQDRLWQMHLQRSIAAGRLAELTGALRNENGDSNSIETDKFLRTMGIYRSAEKAWDALSDKAKANLESYAAGVNAYLDSREGALPAEFVAALEFDIRPWTPIDSLAWLKMMMWDLGGNRGTELMNFTLSSVIASADLTSLNGTYPGEQPFTLPDLNQLYGRLDETAGLGEHWPAIDLPLIERPAHEGIGSNNWVASGSRTASGAPLLANDPHLAISAPAIWYYMGMHSEQSDYHTIGATLPGIPYVVLGRTDRTAWGFTNVGPDVQDYFLERINPDNPDQYQTPDGMDAFQVINEVIKVKEEEDIILKVRETRHGPVMSDIWSPMRTQYLPDGTVAAFQWTALQPGDTTMDAMRMLSRIDSAADIDDFAVHMVAPQQNVVFADVDGGTAYIAPARIPIRGPDNLTMGLAPALGWDAAYDWQGFVPYAEIPRIDNPQLRVTANAKIVEDDYPHFIRFDWSAPYRTDRIVELLGEDTALTPQRFLDIQMDTRANQAAELSSTMIARIQDQVRTLDDPIYAQVLANLIVWDKSNYAAGVESSTMPVYASWIRHFLLNVIQDEVAPVRPLALTYKRFMLRELILGGPEGTSPERWCGTLPAQPGTQADCDALLLDAFVMAVDGLVASHGTDPAEWRWGTLHQAVSENSVFSGLPILGGKADIRREVGGSNHSVNVQAYKLLSEESQRIMSKRAKGEDIDPDSYDLAQDAFDSVHAPSLRHIFDFADLDNSQFIYNAGQSGNLMSGYYDNFADDWADGTMRKLSMDLDDIRPGNIGVLTLTPR